MYVGCQGMYKTDTNMHQSTKKPNFFVCIEKLDCFVLKCVLHREKTTTTTKKILWFFVICTRCTVCYAGLLLLTLSCSDKGGLRITEEFLKVKWKYIVHAFQWATHLDCLAFFLCTKACRQI